MSAPPRRHAFSGGSSGRLTPTGPKLYRLDWCMTGTMVAPEGPGCGGGNLGPSEGAWGKRWRQWRDQRVVLVDACPSAEDFWPEGEPAGGGPSGCFPSAGGGPAGCFPSAGGGPAGCFPSPGGGPIGCFPSPGGRPKPSVVLVTVNDESRCTVTTLPSVFFMWTS